VQPSVSSGGGFGTKIHSLEKTVMLGESPVPESGTGGLHPA